MTTQSGAVEETLEQSLTMQNDKKVTKIEIFYENFDLK